MNPRLQFSSGKKKSITFSPGNFVVVKPFSVVKFFLWDSMFFIFLFLIVHQITKMKTYLNHFLPELNCSFEFNLTKESLTIKCCTLFVSLIEYNLIAYIWSIYPSIHITFTSQRYQLTKLTVVDVYSIAMYLLTSFSREGRILPSRLTVRFILSDPSAVHTWQYSNTSLSNSLIRDGFSDLFFAPIFVLFRLFSCSWITAIFLFYPQCLSSCTGNVYKFSESQ